MLAFGILKVIYAPHKAFKEILQNPKYIGPVIVMILFISASIGTEYARASRINIQQTIPSSIDLNNPDPWTQNSTMWLSNANVSLSGDDSVLYESIKFLIANGTRISMKLQNVGPVNCSSAGGLVNLTFSMKWIHPSATRPENGTLYLNSTRGTDYFYRSMVDLISQTQDSKWSNLTVPVASTAQHWVNSSLQATWSNITGLEIELNWPESARANITVLVDKLFFLSEQFQPLTKAMGNNLAIFAVYTALDYSFYWILFSGALFIVAKLMRIETQMKTAFMLVGYALIGMAILRALFSIFYLTLPSLYLSIDKVTPTYAFENMVLFGFYSALALPIWSVIISILAARTAFNISWVKSAALAAVAFLPYYVLQFLSMLGA